MNTIITRDHMTLPGRWRKAEWRDCIYEDLCNSECGVYVITSTWKPDLILRVGESHVMNRRACAHVETFHAIGNRVQSPHGSWERIMLQLWDAGFSIRVVAIVGDLHTKAERLAAEKLWTKYVYKEDHIPLNQEGQSPEYVAWAERQLAREIQGEQQ